jgi:hypothetical protein
MPWINGKWRPDDDDWMRNVGIYDDLLSKKALYDKGPGHTTVLSELIKTLEDRRDGGPGVTPGYNPVEDEATINESITTQAQAPAPTSLFSMPARTPMRLPTYDAPGLRQTPGWRPMVAPQQQFPPAPPQQMMPPMNIPGRQQGPPQSRPPMPPPPRPPEFQPFPPQGLPPTQIPQPPVRPPFIDPPTQPVDTWQPAPPVDTWQPPIVRPPRPPVRPPIIVRPPRPRPKPPPRPKPTPPPKRKAAPPKRTKRTVASKPPATRPGRTQEGRGPRGARTITGVARSQNTQRGDR